MSDRFEYRVSDSMPVPLRGQLLRLKLASGDPNAKAIAAGQRLRVRNPDGKERVIHVLDHAITGGNATQDRLRKTRELDLVVSFEDAVIDGETIAIGWSLSGPVSG